MLAGEHLITCDTHPIIDIRYSCDASFASVEILSTLRRGPKKMDEEGRFVVRKKAKGGSSKRRFLDNDVYVQRISFPPTVYIVEGKPLVGKIAPSIDIWRSHQEPHVIYHTHTTLAPSKIEGKDGLKHELSRFDSTEQRIAFIEKVISRAPYCKFSSHGFAVGEDEYNHMELEPSDFSDLKDGIDFLEEDSDDCITVDTYSDFKNPPYRLGLVINGSELLWSRDRINTLPRGRLKSGVLHEVEYGCRYDFELVHDNLRDLDTAVKDCLTYSPRAELREALHKIVTFKIILDVTDVTKGEKL